MSQSGQNSDAPVVPAASLVRASQGGFLGISSAAWMRVGLLALLIVVTFWQASLRRWWNKTNPIYGEPNWGHAIVVPIIGLYYLYLHRDELRKTTVTPLLGLAFTRFRVNVAAGVIAAGLLVWFIAPRGLLFATGTITTAGQALVLWGTLGLIFDFGIGSLLTGLLVFTYGIYPGQNDFVKDFGVVITLFGIVLTLCGWQVMKFAWFPIALLVCAIPWPGLVYSWVAGPLQQLAADVAVKVMNIFGVTAVCSGTKIMMGTGRTLNVAEACAGLKSLMTFITVGAAIAFLSNRPLWQKIIVTLSAIPIAILCNVMRVTGQGILDARFGEDVSQGFAHQMVGIVLLVPAFFLILLVGWILDHLFIEELDKTKPAKAAAAAKDLVIELPRRNLAGPAASGREGTA